MNETINIYLLTYGQVQHTSHPPSVRILHAFMTRVHEWNTFVCWCHAFMF